MHKARRTLTLVRGILIVGAVGSFGLTVRGLCQTPAAPSPPQSATPRTASAPTAATATSPTTQVDVEKRDLELGKLRGEIQKLQADIKKAEWDSYTAWIGPALSVITIVVLAATLVSQRKTALEVQQRQGAAALALQEKQGQAALELQKAQSSAALEIKVVDLVMSSRSPALALGRAELLRHLNKDTSNYFLQEVIQKAADRDFPGDLGFELRTKVFEVLAGKYTEPADVALLARKIFSGDDWLKEDLVPRTAATPGTHNS